MYTQCPDCGKSFPVTKKQQRAKKAQIYCSDCKKKFNVLDGLTEKKPSLNNAIYNNQSKPAQLIEDARTEITPALLAEAKTEFIPKEVLTQQTTTNKKSEIHPYLSNISSVLRKNRTKVAVDVQQVPAVEERLPWESDIKQSGGYWSMGAVASLLLLLGQAVYFHWPKASQHTTYRPFLENLCARIGCILPDYENLSEIGVLKSSFEPQPDETIVFKAVINNQAAFKQRMPNIQLNLLGYNEELIAQRVFRPNDYVQQLPARLIMNPDETVEAMLTITVPMMPVGGYNFNLVY